MSSANKSKVLGGYVSIKRYLDNVKYEMHNKNIYCEACEYVTKILDMLCEAVRCNSKTVNDISIQEATNIAYDEIKQIYHNNLNAKQYKSEYDHICSIFKAINKELREVKNEG